jgi:hypothetical protein
MGANDSAHAPPGNMAASAIIPAVLNIFKNPFGDAHAATFKSFVRATGVDSFFFKVEGGE